MWCKAPYCFPIVLWVTQRFCEDILFVLTSKAPTTASKINTAGNQRTLPVLIDGHWPGKETIKLRLVLR